jgi:hypothetical protein
MPYFEQSDMTGLVPEDWLSDGMDDAGTGTPDAFDAVQASAENAINGALAGRYEVPLTTTGNAGLTACVKEIGVCLAVEALYIRRASVIDEKSLLAKRIARAWSQLDSLAAGTHPLSIAVPRANDSVEIIGEDSRVYSTSLAA